MAPEIMQLDTTLLGKTEYRLTCWHPFWDVTKMVLNKCRCDNGNFCMSVRVDSRMMPPLFSSNRQVGNCKLWDWT